jgi:hypothetical protein
MKRFFVSVILFALANCPAVHAQDAATDERIKQLNGRIDDLRESQDALKKHIERLVKEVETVREQASKPTGNYASVEDLKALAKSVEEVDRKRVKDYENIDTKLQELKKLLLNPNSGTTKPPKKGATTAVPDAGTEKSGSDKANADKPQADEKGYPYTIKKNDTLDAIVLAYKEKNIKVTVDQILKANPGLVPERMRTGQKIWIPAPQS